MLKIQVSRKQFSLNINLCCPAVYVKVGLRKCIGRRMCKVRRICDISQFETKVLQTFWIWWPIGDKYFPAIFPTKIGFLGQFETTVTAPYFPTASGRLFKTNISHQHSNNYVRCTISDKYAIFCNQHWNWSTIHKNFER